jgi:serine/threonine protein kinase
MTERLAAALGDRYTIVREIGRGGMATVYLAQDLRHDRPVALKVLGGDVSAALGAERFLREIKITAQLNHPHILPLLDSGDADGLLFYVMPYVAGESLRGLLNRRGRLSLDEAVHIAKQIADALDHAHRKSVVHRDVKPENVLFSEGHAIVSDFGIARAVSAAGLAQLTGTGLPLGTLGYMSPEQAAASASIDERTDVFALASVTYEMLVGSTPGAWMTEEDIRLGRYSDAPAEHREELDRLPGRVEQTLVRSMALRPSDRFDTPGVFVEELVAAAGGSRSMSDSQVEEILRRATELELEDPGAEAALTMGSVEQVAAQVGIAPETVRRAARDLDIPDTGRPVPAVPERGRKTDTIQVDRLANRKVDEADYEALVNEIHSTLGLLGHVSTLGNTLTWSPAAQGWEARKIIVTISPLADGTHIHVEERLEISGWRFIVPGWGAGAGALLMFLFFMFAGIEPVGALLVLLLAAGVAGGVGTATGLLRLAEHRRTPELQMLADRLAMLVEERGRLGPGE